LSRRTVNIILVLYLIVVWAAVIFRIDRFPITWVPMYSDYKTRDTISAKVWDKKKIKRGLFVTHKDGSTSYVSPKDLNIPKPNFRRLYYQRMFGGGPPKHKQGNRNLSTFNRFVRGLGEEEENFSVDWDWRIFWVLNKTLKHEPEDPKFIVKVQADYQKRIYRKADLMKQDISKAEIATRHALIEWQDEWLPRWEHGLL